MNAITDKCEYLHREILETKIDFFWKCENCDKMTKSPLDYRVFKCLCGNCYSFYFWNDVRGYESNECLEKIRQGGDK